MGRWEWVPKGPLGLGCTGSLPVARRTASPFLTPQRYPCSLETSPRLGLDAGGEGRRRLSIAVACLPAAGVVRKATPAVVLYGRAVFWSGDFEARAGDLLCCLRGSRVVRGGASNRRRSPDCCRSVLVGRLRGPRVGCEPVWGASRWLFEAVPRTGAGRPTAAASSEVFQSVSRQNCAPWRAILSRKARLPSSVFRLPSSVFRLPS